MSEEHRVGGSIPSEATKSQRVIEWLQGKRPCFDCKRLVTHGLFIVYHNSPPLARALLLCCVTCGKKRGWYNTYYEPLGAATSRGELEHFEF